MKSNREGKSVPQVVFKTRLNNAWKDVTTDQLFKDKTVKFIGTVYYFY